MTHSKDVASALELTKAFGWEEKHLHEAHDPLEMMRLLINRLVAYPDGALIKRSLMTTLLPCLGSMSRIEESMCL